MACQVGQPLVPIFALIIGINDYANIGKLSGAVADANAIKRYLEDVLLVPRGHIRTLYNTEATRNAIIKAFGDIENDEKIDKGDPIVIFYAGHGGELLAPGAWTPQEEIECLFPQDLKANGMAPIPDRTIGTLIGDIAKAKGNNITVIFDCCFSGSGTRDLDLGEDYVPRSVDLKFDIPETLDDDIWGSRDVTSTNDFACHSLQSHVLLAACGKNELAYERKGGGGQFTSALLEKLKSCAVSSLTYAELMGQIQLKKQHPQCEGYNQHRFLFNSRVPVGGQIYYPVQAHQGGKYVIGAGLANGVSPGVAFTLYNDNKLALGVVTVDEASLIGDFETTVTSHVLTGVLFARLTRIGKLPLYVNLEGNRSSSLEALLRGGDGTTAQIFQLVEAENAKLEVAIENDQVIFKVLDKLVEGYELTQLPYKATLDSVAHVLGSVAHYYWFLGLAKEQDSTKPEVDFYRLEVIDYDDWGNPVFSPHGVGFCQKDPQSSSPDVIDFVVDPDACYGVKITNNTPWDLYLNVFLFNNSSLSIVPYYIQTIVGELEAPLKKGETFTIGYGSAETPPLTFSFMEGRHIDVGYLKLIFATRPIDLSDIIQPSPFSSINAREGIDDDAPRGAGRGVIRMALSVAWSFIRKDDMWFTLDIPVVQRRGTSN